MKYKKLLKHVAECLCCLSSDEEDAPGQNKEMSHGYFLKVENLKDSTEGILFQYELASRTVSLKSPKNMQMCATFKMCAYLHLID